MTDSGRSQTTGDRQTLRDKAGPIRQRRSRRHLRSVSGSHRSHTATNAILSASESARCRPVLIDAPTSFLRGFPLPEASTAEDAFHPVVALVAGVLEQETIDGSQ